MVNFPSGYLESKLYARALQRWADAARKAATVDLATLRRQRSRARLLRANWIVLFTAQKTASPCRRLAPAAFRNRITPIGHGDPNFGAGRLPRRGCRRSKPNRHWARK